MNTPKQGTLPDIQCTPPAHQLPISRVGISNVRLPILVDGMRDGSAPNHSVATATLFVNLPRHEKGTHMSRLALCLQGMAGQTITSELITATLAEARTLLDAEVAELTLAFPAFFSKDAPVSGVPGIVHFDVELTARAGASAPPTLQMTVKAVQASLCPCSKEISDYGAHNQRSRIDITVETRIFGPHVWFSDLYQITELAASCPMFSVLKRPDERWVTMAAYDNPKFVEDIVRGAAHEMLKLEDTLELTDWSVRCINEESIHLHDAQAEIRRSDLTRRN